MNIKTSDQVQADMAKTLSEFLQRRLILSEALRFHEQSAIDYRNVPSAYEQHRVFAGGLRVALDIMEGGRNFDLYNLKDKKGVTING